MGAATATAGARERVAVKAKKGPQAPGPPWWIWLAVAAVVIFCLFPFYWLINISLKTGADLSSADLFPPSPRDPQWIITHTASTETPIAAAAASSYTSATA
jgi:multiple sugar transport system permease protein